ncbi:hypothetical protein ACVWY5_001087 [Bradyrhizobium sp. USDA 3256]
MASPGRLRNRTFYSLAELNGAIAERLAKLNDERVLRQYGRTRRQLFEEIDAPNLKLLPASRGSMPNGADAGSASTITSRSNDTTTRCPIASPVER